MNNNAKIANFDSEWVNNTPNGVMKNWNHKTDITTVMDWVNSLKNQIEADFGVDQIADYSKLWDEQKKSIDQLMNSADLTLMINNMADYLSREKNRGNSHYSFKKIFENATLSDEQRVNNATADLQELWLLQWAMSDRQRDAMLKAHHLFPEKWVFMLSKEEQFAKIRVLMNEWWFTKEQSKMLMDRGYCAFLSYIRKYLTVWTIAVAILWYIVLTKVWWCEAISAVWDGVKWWIEVVKDVAETGWKVLSAPWGIVKWISAKMSSALWTAEIKIRELQIKRSVLQNKIETVKQSIETENNGDWWWLPDSDKEDDLQKLEKQLNEQLKEIETELEEANLELLLIANNEKYLDVPADKIAQMAKDMKDRSQEKIYETLWIWWSDNNPNTSEMYENSDTDGDGTISPEEIKETNKTNGNLDNNWNPIEVEVIERNN